MPDKLVQIWEVASYITVVFVSLSCLSPAGKLYGGCKGFKRVWVWKVLVSMVLALIISSLLYSVEVISKALAPSPWEAASRFVQAMRSWAYLVVSVLEVLFVILLKKFRQVYCP